MNTLQFCYQPGTSNSLNPTILAAAANLNDTDLLVDTTEKCLQTLKLLQETNAAILGHLQDKHLCADPDMRLTQNRLNLECVFQQIEKLRNQSHLCLERYRWTPDVGDYNAKEHQTRCQEQERLESLEAKIFDTAVQNGWIGKTVETSPELPSTEKVARYCKNHFLIPLGLTASLAAFAGLIPMDNPLGCMAPAVAGIATSLAVDRFSTLTDTLDLGQSFIKGLGNKALFIGTSLSASALYYDAANNYDRVPYIMGAAVLLQTGSYFIGRQNNAGSLPLKAPTSAEKIHCLGKWWFQNGKKTGLVAAAAIGGLSRYVFDQSLYATGAFALGTYLFHAGYASLHQHANPRASK